MDFRHLSFHARFAEVHQLVIVSLAFANIEVDDLKVASANWLGRVMLRIRLDPRRS